MNVRISKSELCGKVCVPPSKSVAHRLMIAAALAGGKFFCKDGGKDIEATAGCLEIMTDSARSFCASDNAVCQAGSEFSSNGYGCNLHRLNAGESGSTLRFLLPIVCALGMECIFEGAGRLKDRPLDGLIDVLKSHGCLFEKLGNSQLPLRVSGELTAGEYIIDGSVSSQYITGLLFALPLVNGDSSIVIDGELVSKNYVDITLGVLDDFGIIIEKTNDGYFVKGNQKYVMPDSLSVEGDWSSAGFMLVLGVLAGEVKIGGLDADSLQGDKIVVDLLKSAGANIEWDGEIISAKKSKLFAIDFDAQHCPDAVPIMATALSFANGISHIRHVDRLRDKESDRLGAVCAMLGDFGIRTEYGNDTLTVYGGRHKPCVTHGFCDHRMAMSAMVCAICTDGESEVKGVECIAKSYPSFIEHAISLGADIRCES